MAFAGKFKIQILYPIQNHRTFVLLSAKNCFAGALKDYYKFNKCFPSRIIVYRDGVGDGQLHSVVNYEVAQIIDSIKSMGQEYM